MAKKTKLDYTFKAEVVKVVDGDTIDCLVHLGFHVTTMQRFRLFGINTPETRGVERSKAAEFSFLLSLPAILGASLIQLRDVMSNPHLAQDLDVYLVGAATAFLVGYSAIRLLLKVIRKGKFQYFAYYCFAVGLLFLILTR